MLCVYFPEQSLYNTSNQLFKILRRFCCHPELVRKQTAKVCCADTPLPILYSPCPSVTPSIFHSTIFPSHSTYHSYPLPVSLIGSPDTSHGFSLRSLLECSNFHYVYQRHTYCIDIYQSCERDTIETIFGKM